MNAAKLSPMKLVIFGLTMSSSWGNGHATLWRGLCKSLIERGHDITFLERDTPYYSAHRDLTEIPGMKLKLYSQWEEVLPFAKANLLDADVGMITSYCPDAVPASDLLRNSPVPLRTFYDLDAPVTLDKVRQGEPVFYIPEGGLAGFDLVLSYTGGRALADIQTLLKAEKVAALYGSVDPEVHRPTEWNSEFCCDLSYLGTYAKDRHSGVERFFLKPAYDLPHRRFHLAGAMYPTDFPWRENIFYIQHLSPHEHSTFYCSSRLTLNVTREAMARYGYCPSGRLFEAAACGVPVLSDAWEGLDTFFTPDSEILVPKNYENALGAIELSDDELIKIGRNARERTLSCHTSKKRAEELEAILANAKRAVLPEKNAPIAVSTRSIWGIIPAAGAGSRIQPLAFSKELLPVGSKTENNTERPRAVSEFLAERMILGGAEKICFVISPGKSDILEYFGGKIGSVDICYAVQPTPSGLCDAIFRAISLVQRQEIVTVGLPDTVWFPKTGFNFLPDDVLSLLLFPVEHPEFFDAVVTRGEDEVKEIRVKQPEAVSHWIWGAFKMPGSVFHDLHKLWLERRKADEYIGTLFNEYIRRGGKVKCARAGEAYVDVGTLNGYREAIQILAQRTT